MDYGMIIQVAISLVLIIGGMFLGKYLASKKALTKEDLQLAQVIQSFVEMNVLTNEQAKQIARAVGKAIRFVEAQMTDAPNQEKEDTALEMVLEALAVYDWETDIDVDAVRQVIRLAVAFMEPTHQ